MEESKKKDVEELVKAFDAASQSSQKYMLGFAEGLRTAQMLKG